MRRMRRMRVRTPMAEKTPATAALFWKNEVGAPLWRASSEVAVPLAADDVPDAETKLMFVTVDVLGSPGLVVGSVGSVVAGVVVGEVTGMTLADVAGVVRADTGELADVTMGEMGVTEFAVAGAEVAATSVKDVENVFAAAGADAAVWLAIAWVRLNGGCPIGGNAGADAAAFAGLVTTALGVTGFAATALALGIEALATTTSDPAETAWDIYYRTNVGPGFNFGAT
ncbi:hypothetical protein B0H11DRAFT_1954929 [Mycena galericulata]|nr:hypothetical protein B0H11DRAFT_1954929 [Mycena galericulata]